MQQIFHKRYRLIKVMFFCGKNFLAYKNDAMISAFSVQIIINGTRMGNASETPLKASKANPYGSNFFSIVVIYSLIKCLSQFMFSRITLVGIPTFSVLGDMFFVTIDCMPIIALSPIVTPFRILLCFPHQT